MTQEQSAQLNDIANRLRKLEEDMIRNTSIIDSAITDVLKSLGSRVGTLEKHDEEFMAMVHQSCTLKDGQIAKAREEAITVATNHANNNHKQTWAVLAGMFTLFVGALVYFNAQIQDRALASQRNTTNIEGISHSLDKIDSKLDKLSYEIQEIQKGK